VGHTAGFLDTIRRELEEYALFDKLAKEHPALDAPNPPRIVRMYRIWKSLGVPPYDGGFMKWPAEDVHALTMAEAFLG